MRATAARVQTASAGSAKVATASVQRAPLQRLIEKAGPGEPTGQPAPEAGPNVPPALAGVWRQAGLRMWLDGFLWLTDPAEFTSVVAKLGQDEDGLVFARTGLGDLLLQQLDKVYLANMRVGSVDPIESDPLNVLNFYFTDADFRDRILGHALYREARQRLPRPNHHECYGFVAAQRLGGPGTAESLSVVEMIPYLEILAQL
jgi:hypothetical protein